MCQKHESKGFHLWGATWTKTSYANVDTDVDNADDENVEGDNADDDDGFNDGDGDDDDNDNDVTMLVIFANWGAAAKISTESQIASLPFVRYKLGRVKKWK